MEKELESKEQYDLFLELFNSFTKFGPNDVENYLTLKIKEIGEK